MGKSVWKKYRKDSEIYMLWGLFIFSNRSGCSKNKIKIKVDVELGGSLKFFFRYYIFLFSLLVYNDFI